MPNALWVFLLSIVVVLGYLLFWPVPVSPVAFKPAANPGMAGVYAPNELLRAAQPVATGVGEGPEDVAKGPDGFFYTGLQDGRIVRFREEGGPPEAYVNTSGRPLGMRFDRQGNLIVADALRGLLSINPNRDITLLTDNAGGERLLFPNDLDIAPDGTIWFSNSAQRDPQRHFVMDLLETRATGSLLRYDPMTGETTVALSGLMFANGVAVGPNGDYVLVNETIAARITRLWLRGSDTGRSETFINLPGYPDNLSFNGKGIFWVALFSPRIERLERSWTSPFLRKVLLRLPEAIIFRNVGAAYSWVIGVRSDGKVIQNLQDSSGGSGIVTSANEFDGKLYLGSVTTSFVSRYPIL